MGVLTLDDLAALTDYVSGPRSGGHVIRPGCYFVAVGGGLAGRAVRRATNSWAGHAGIFVGGGRAVEAVPPVALNVAMDSRPEARFNYREGRDLTDEQRLAIINQAHDLVGTAYDVWAYVGFLEEMFDIRTNKSRDKIFNTPHRVCSALVADCYQVAGIDLDPDSEITNLITPADLYNRITVY